MNTTTIDAAIIFARRCLRAASAADARREHLFAAELRAPAQQAIREANAAVAHMREVTPGQERARAYAATILQVFGAWH
jgi:hypothetical protein